jgi:hypothetical protein
MRRFLIALACLAIIGYGLFEARRLIEGPRITIRTPQNGTATSSPAIVVSGEAHNISFLTINDRPAYTNESGQFSEILTPPSGYTVVVVAATDRFGRRTSQSVSITVLNYCPA